MPTRRNRLILLSLWSLLYCSYTLLTPPLLDDADSVHAEVSREMLLRHDWTTLYANGIRYLEKAPLLYWSMATSMKLFGVHAAAARLPLAFTVLALALVVEAFARRAFDSTRAGLYAGLILLSSFGIFIFTRITIPDAMVCLWLTLAIYCYWLTGQSDESQNQTPHTKDVSSRPDPEQAKRVEGEVEGPASLPRSSGAPSFETRRVGTIVSLAAPSRLPCYAFAAACALGVLTKGLIGLVFPIAIVTVHLLLTRGLRGAITRILRFNPITSTAIFFAIAAPWHILIGLANPTHGNPGHVTFSNAHWQVPQPTDGNVHGWFWFYFVNEHILRYLNLRVPRDYDTVPLLLFWGLILVWLMPWSAFLFHSVAQVPWRKAFTRTALTPRQSTLLLLGIWAAIPLLFFSLSTRQEYYVLPALPALILLIAAWLNDEAVEAESFTVPSPLVASGQRIALVMLVIGSIAAVAAGFFIIHSQPAGPNTDLASLLKQNPGDYALSFGHFLDLNARAMGAFRTPLALTAVALFGSTLAALLLRRAYRPHAANIALAAGAFLFLLAAHLGLQIFSPVLTSKQLADAIAPLIKPSDIVVIHGEYEAGSALGFYLHRNDIHIYVGRSSNLWYGSFFPDAPPIFEDKLSLSLKWDDNTRRIFLWQDLSDPLPSLPGKTFFIAQSGGKEILSNQPNPY